MSGTTSSAVVPSATTALTTAAAADTRAPKPARVAVLGASGYAGAEFVRLALGHPGIERLWLVTRDAEGARARAGDAARAATALVPGLDGRAAELPAVIDVAHVESLVSHGEADTLVVALPHGAWHGLATDRPVLAARPAHVVDLSSDHRDGSAGYVYGLPEAFRSDVRASARVANPGCYATAAALALWPAAQAGWIAGPVVVSALSGVSGAGRAAELRTSFVELDGNASFYNVGTVHAHVPEMERTLARAAGAPISLAFAPQLVPMARGILLTAQVPLASPVTPEEAHAAYAAHYASETFVRVCADGEWPETRAVRASNRADLQVTTVFGGRVLLATAALDNLVKGAAGQAMQNLNLMLGWPEATGLSRHGQPW